MSDHPDYQLITPDDTRKPVTWLNYPHPPAPDPATPAGPTDNGELLWPVAIDAKSVGFSYIPPAAILAAIAGAS